MNRSLALLCAGGGNDEGDDPENHRGIQSYGVVGEKNCLRSGGLTSRLMQLALLVVLSTACHRDENENESPRDSAAAIARMRASLDRAIASLQRAGVPKWTVSRIGLIDGTKQLHTEIGDAKFAPSGELVVSHPRAGELSVYSPGGQLIRKLGRLGEGPGEFSYVRTFGFLSDTLWISDWMARRVTLMSLKGDVYRVISFPPQDELSIEHLIPEDLQGRARNLTLMGHDAISPDGDGVAGVGPFLSSDVMNTIPAYPLVRVDRDGRPTSLLGLIRVTTISFPVSEDNGKTQYSTDFHAPFGNELIAFAISPGFTRMAVVTADYKSATVQVVQRSLKGDTLSTRRYPFEKHPVSREDFDAALTAMSSVAPDAKAKDQLRKALRALPQFHVPYSFAFLADDGSLWLSSYTDQTRTLWTCIGPSGQIEGHLLLDAQSSPRVMRDGVVWLHVADSNSVPSLVRYQIAK